MTKDEALKKMQAVKSYMTSGNPIWSVTEMGEAFDLAIDALEQQWIPCSERLPKEGERVLATHLGGLNPNNQVIEHIYQNGKFTMGWDMDMNPSSPTFGQRYMGEVIAWMPLPEPWRGEPE